MLNDSRRSDLISIIYFQSSKIIDAISFLSYSYVSQFLLVTLTSRHSLKSDANEHPYTSIHSPMLRATQYAKHWSGTDSGMSIAGKDWVKYGIKDGATPSQEKVPQQESYIDQVHALGVNDKFDKMSKPPAFKKWLVGKKTHLLSNMSKYGERTEWLASELTRQ